MNTRDEHIQKIAKAKAELEAAGPIHRRDLTRYIHRLEKELRIYDRTAGTANSRTAQTGARV